MMEDASDIVMYDEEDLMGGNVGAVAFPGVVKYGEEQELDKQASAAIAAPATADEGREGNPVPEQSSPTAVAAPMAPSSNMASGKPRVLVKARILCIVPEDPDE